MSSRKMSLRMDREVREAFGLFDRDGDGKVTKQEIAHLIQSLEGDPNCTHVQVRIIITRLAVFSLFVVVFFKKIRKFEFIFGFRNSEGKTGMCDEIKSSTLFAHGRLTQIRASARPLV